MAVEQNFADALRQKLPPTGGVTGAGQYGAYGGPGSATPGQQLATELQRSQDVPNGPLTGARTTATGLQAAPAQAAGAQPAQPQAAAPAAAQQPVAAQPGQVAGVTLPNGQWVPSNHPLAQTAGAQPGAAGGQPAASQNPLGDVFRTALNQRISANPTPTSVADDPVLAAQSGANRQASARDAARTRSEAMESLGATGLESSGAAGSMARKVNADRRMEEGAFDANLLGGARDSRMQELQAFLGIAGNTLSNEERNSLERELATMDDATKRAGIASQTQLGQGDLALRGELGRGGLNQNLLSILLNNRTDNDRTGLQAAGMEMGANTAALQALLGGTR